MTRTLRHLTAIITALLLLFGRASGEEFPALLQVHQIAIGQADAYLIRCGDTAVMIDGGNAKNHTPDDLMDYLEQAGFDSLDACIVTHYHTDHAGNLNLLLSEFGREDTQVFGPTKALDKRYLPLAAGEYLPMRDGDKLIIGPLTFTCVGPATVDHKGSDNEDSLNILMTYGKRTFLFTGDAVRSQSVMRRHGALLKNIDVLKFPHHGIQPFAIDETALKELNPKVILVPGLSGWGVQDLAWKNGLRAEVCAANEGHVVILSDGNSLEVMTDVQPGQVAQR